MQPFRQITRKEQEKIKPAIEEMVDIYLGGDAKQAVTSLVTWLRGNGIPPKWSSLNGWTAGYNRISICSIYLPYPNGRDVTELCLYLNNIDGYAASVDEAGLAGIVRNGVFYCVLAPGQSGVGCHPTKKCGRGVDMTVLGTTFHDTCRHRPQTWVYDPDAQTVDGVIKLLAMERGARDGGAQ